MSVFNIKSSGKGVVFRESACLLRGRSAGGFSLSCTIPTTSLRTPTESGECTVKISNPHQTIIIFINDPIKKHWMGFYSSFDSSIDVTPAFEIAPLMAVLYSSLSLEVLLFGLRICRSFCTAL